MASVTEDLCLSHLLIRASAGTGKTYQLASRYLRLLFAGTEVDEILATTFTRKAAGEILTRVLRWVADAATDERARRQLAEAVRRPELTAGECLGQLRRLTRQLHRLRIATLDSFFVNLASGFELELGLPPNWSICDPVDEPALRSQALARLLQGRETDATQWTYLLAKGAAKRSVHDLLMHTVQESHSIYGETTPEVWQVLQAPRGLNETDLLAAVDRLAQVDLPDNGSIRKAHQKAVDTAQQGDWQAFVAAGIAKKIVLGETTYLRWTIDPAIASTYQPLIEHARATLIAELVWQTEAAYDLLKRFDTCFRQLQWEQGVVRFCDVPPAIVMLMSHTHDQRLAYRMGGRINHLLLDEFQDTSLVQWRSLEPISRRITSANSEKHSLFCVGDTKQAIYGWRGGMVEIFEHLESQLTGLECQSLTASFRSSPAVIEFVNQVFSGMVQHNNLESLEPGVRKWCQAFEPHTTHRTDLPGYACLMTTAEADKEESASEITMQETVALVEQLCQSAPGMSIAVLTRTNAPISPLIYRLRQRGIAASEEGGNPLTDSAAVQVVLSLLTLADHPADTVAQFHVAHSPLGPSLPWTPDCVGHHDRARALALRTRQRLLREGYGPCIADWAEWLQSSCTRREWDRLQQCVELAYRYDRRSSLRAVDFVNLVTAQRVADPSSAPVRVMTVHQSKGLEFDIVVFNQLAGNLHPLQKDFAVAWDCQTLRATHVTRTAGNDVLPLLPEAIQKVHADCLERELGESLCVLYVALTRAKHALYLLTEPRGYVSKNKIKHLKSYGGLLHAALAPDQIMPPSSLVYACGDPQWYKRLQTPSKQAAPKQAAPKAAAAKQARSKQPHTPGDSDSAALPSRPRLAPAAARAQRSFQTVSPSSLEGGEQLRVGDILRPQRSEAMRRGTLLHAWLETISWLDERPLDHEQLLAIAERLGVPDRGQTQRWLQEFLDRIDRAPLRELLRRADYNVAQRSIWPQAVTAQLQSQDPEWQVKRETRIVSRDGDRLLVGNVDRLVVARCDQQVIAADIIDFKTDALASAEAWKQRADYYRPQLQAYRQAVARMLRLPQERIAARLVFVPLGKIVPIS